MKNILIANPERLQKKIDKFKLDGAEKIHILADFDRTLTKATVNGQKSPTVIAQIRNGKYLTPDYASKAERLAAQYYPIEKDPHVLREEKDRLMHEWWSKHFDLLISSGLNRKIMKKIVSKRTLQMREGSLEFFDILRNHNIPLIIMSAAPGDMISMYLEQDGKLTKNVCIISNFFDFNDQGFVIKVREPIIHSLNKYETMVRDYPFYRKIEDRKNVILFGDSIDDIGMVEGFDYDEIIKIGFLNEKIEENKKYYLENFDIIITNDGNMSEINKIIDQILK